MAETASDLGAVAERLLASRYAQENISDAIESLREAYARASKRRVKPARDEKVRQQVSRAVQSITEAAEALQTGRQKPRRRLGRRLVLAIGVGALGAAAAFGASEELRNAVFGRETDEFSSAGPIPEVPARESAAA